MDKKEKKIFKKINVDAKTRDKLLFVSKVTSIPMARLINQIVEAMFALCVNYKDATFALNYRVTTDEIFITIRGYDKTLTVERFEVDPNLTEQGIDELIQMKMKHKMLVDEHKAKIRCQSVEVDKHV